MAQIGAFKGYGFNRTLIGNSCMLKVKPTRHRGRSATGSGRNWRACRVAITGRYLVSCMEHDALIVAEHVSGHGIVIGHVRLSVYFHQSF